MGRIKPGSAAVTHVEKLRYPTLPPAGVSTITIEEQPDYPYSSDEEDDQILVDHPISIPQYAIVASAQAEQPKNPDLVSKEPVRRIFRRRIQNKD